MATSEFAATTSLSQESGSWVIRDAIAIAQRNLIAYIRIPQLLIFSTI